MAIELPKEARAQAIASIERWFQDERGERVGNITASALLNYVLLEIGPSVYNQTITNVQDRLAQRVAEIDVEIHEDEFGYWRQFDKKPRGKA